MYCGMRNQRFVVQGRDLTRDSWWKELNKHQIIQLLGNVENLCTDELDNTPVVYSCHGYKIWIMVKITLNLTIAVFDLLHKQHARGNS